MRASRKPHAPASPTRIAEPVRSAPAAAEAARPCQHPDKELTGARLLLERVVRTLEGGMYGLGVLHVPLHQLRAEVGVARAGDQLVP